MKVMKMTIAALALIVGMTSAMDQNTLDPSTIEKNGFGNTGFGDAFALIPKERNGKVSWEIRRGAVSFRFSSGSVQFKTKGHDGKLFESHRIDGKYIEAIPDKASLSQAIMNITNKKKLLEKTVKKPIDSPENDGFFTQTTRGRARAMRPHTAHSPNYTENVSAATRMSRLSLSSVSRTRSNSRTRRCRLPETATPNWTSGWYFQTPKTQDNPKGHRKVTVDKLCRLVIRGEIDSNTLVYHSELRTNRWETLAEAAKNYPILKPVKALFDEIQKQIIQIEKRLIEIVDQNNWIPADGWTPSVSAEPSMYKNKQTGQTKDTWKEVQQYMSSCRTVLKKLRAEPLTYWTTASKFLAGGFKKGFYAY